MRGNRASRGEGETEREIRGETTKVERKQHALEREKMAMVDLTIGLNQHLSIRLN
jgi:hypothetical protein